MNRSFKRIVSYFYWKIFWRTEKLCASFTAQGQAVGFRRAASGCSSSHACPDPPTAHSALMLPMSLLLCSKEDWGTGNTCSLLHQLVPSRCVQLETSKQEDLVHRSTETWEGSVVPFIQLPALLCLLRSSLHSNSLRKENSLAFFNHKPHCTLFRGGFEKKHLF